MRLCVLLLRVTLLHIFPRVTENSFSFLDCAHGAGGILVPDQASYLGSQRVWSLTAGPAKQFQGLFVLSTLNGYHLGSLTDSLLLDFRLLLVF